MLVVSSLRYLRRHDAKNTSVASAHHRHMRLPSWHILGDATQQRPNNARTCNCTGTNERRTLTSSS